MFSDDDSQDFARMRENLRWICEQVDDYISILKSKKLEMLSQLNSKLSADLAALLANLQQPELMLNYSSYKTTISRPIFDRQIRDQLASIDIQGSSPIFSLINDWTEKALRFINAVSNTDIKDKYSNEIELIAECRRRLYDFRNDVISSRGESRLNHLEGKVRGHGSTRYFYLSGGVVDKVVEHFPEGPKSDTARLLSRNETTGSHPNFKLHGNFHKIDGDAPWYQKYFYVLGTILGFQVSAPAESYTFESLRGKIDVMISLSKGEIDLHKVLENHPEWVPLINKRNYNAQFIMDLLVRVRDRKAENIQVEVTRNGNDEVVEIKMIDIDADLILGDEIVHFGVKKEYDCEYKSILPFLPQFKEPFDKQYRDHFLGMPAELIVIKLLSSLLDDPIKFLPKTILRLYEHIKKIQSLMRSNLNLTPKELMTALYPEVAKLYEWVENIDPKAPILKKSMSVFGRGRPSLDKVLTRDELAKLNRFTRSLEDGYEKATQTLLESAEEFFRELDFSKLDNIHLQAIVFQNISAFSALKHCRFANCLALDDNRLVELGRQLKELEDLVLENCLNIKANGITQLFNLKPQLQLTLVNMTGLSSGAWLSAFKNCAKLKVVFAERTFNIPDQYSELLNYSIEKNHHSLRDALLVYGVYQKQASSVNVLLVACEQILPLVVEELLQLGVFCNQVMRFRDKDSTFLDIIIEILKSQSEDELKEKCLRILELFIMYGANNYRQVQTPAEVINCLTFKPERLKANKKLRQQLNTFCCFYGLHTQNTISLLIDSDVQSLALGAPPEYQLSKFKLTSEILEKIIEKLKAPFVLDLTNCTGLTRNLLMTLCDKARGELHLTYDQCVDCGLASPKAWSQAALLSMMQVSIKVASLCIRGALVQSELLDLKTFLNSTNDLVHFEWVNAELSSYNIENFVGCLENNKSLRVINLNGCKITDTLPLQSVSKSRSPSPASVGYSKDEILSRLFEVLSKHPRMECLYIERSYVGPKCAEKIKILIETSNTLKELSLQGNPLTDIGASYIADGIIVKSKESRTACLLRSLNLNGTGLTEKSVNLIEALKCLSSSLRFLDIGYNDKLGDNVAIKLLHLLQMNPALTLRPDNIGAEKSIMESIQNCLVSNRQAVKSENVVHSNMNNSCQTSCSLLPPEYQPVAPPTLPMSPTIWANSRRPSSSGSSSSLSSDSTRNGSESPGSPARAARLGVRQ